MGPIGVVPPGPTPMSPNASGVGVVTQPATAPCTPTAATPQPPPPCPPAPIGVEVLAPIAQLPQPAVLPVVKVCPECGQGAPPVPPSTADQFTIAEVVGARFTWLSTSTVSIGTDGKKSAVRDQVDTFNIVVTGTVGPIDVTVVGPNGRDGGVEMSDTWYAVFLIADSSGVQPIAGLLSTSASAPTLPSGYDKFRRVAWVRNNSTSDFRKAYQRGDGIDRTYDYDVDRSELLVLSNGTASVFTALPLDIWMPPTSRFAILKVGFNTANASDVLNIRQTGSTVANPVTFFQEASVTSGSRKNTSFSELVLPMPSIDYQVVPGGGGTPSADIYVHGFRDSLAT